MAQDSEYLTRSEWLARGYRVCSESNHRNKYGEAVYAKHHVQPLTEHYHPLRLQTE